MKIVTETRMDTPDGFTTGHVLFNGVPYRVTGRRGYGKRGESTHYVTLEPVSFTVKLEPGEQLEYINRYAWED